MDKEIKVLHLSTHDEDCGVGKYQEMFLDTLSSYGHITNKFFDISPNQLKVMSRPDFHIAIKQLENELAGYDILHVQHEFSFFYNDEFTEIIGIAKRKSKKVVVTLHASPFVAYKPPRLGGVGPKSIVDYLKAIRNKRRFFNNFVKPIRRADMVIAHNQITINSLITLGVNKDNIRDLVIPVPELDLSAKSDEIKKSLSHKEGDVIYCTVGFLHKYKGLKEAIKALRFLPNNYKLAIIGGVHPQAGDESIYDEITDLIRDISVIDRVYITGFVNKDEQLNALVRECDVTVYPYDKNYYSHVSSASLNNAFANHMPAVAYPTGSFKEINTRIDAITLTSSCSYYELARALRSIDLKAAREISTRYAEEMSYSKVAPRIVGYYHELTGT